MSALPARRAPRPDRPAWLVAGLALLLLGAAAALPAASPAASAPPAQAPNLVVHTELGGASHALWLAPGRAYVGVGRRLLILDTSAPLAPTVLGQSSPLPGLVLGLTVAGTTAYVSLGPDGLAILDVASPGAIRQLGFLAGNAAKVVLAAPFAYVVGGTIGVRIVDASDPAQPTVVGSFGEFVTDLAVGGGHAYTVARNLVIWDLSAAGGPNAIRELANWADGVVIGGTTLYAATSEEAPGGRRNGFLETWDIANPRRPPHLGRVPLAGQGRFLGLEGSELRVLAGNRLQTFDASNPAGLPELRSLAVLLAAQQAATAGDQAWLAAGSQGLRAVALDGSSPDTGTRLLEVPGRAESLALDGDRLYLEDADQRLLIYHVDHLASGPLGQFPVRVDGAALAARDGYLYLGTPERELKIYDVREPAAPRELARLPFDRPISRIAVDGGYAYLAADPYVRIIDVRNPAAPNQVARVEPSGGALDLALDGRWLYVLGPNTGARPQPSLKVLDVIAPNAPVEMALVAAKSSSGGLTAGDQLVFVDALQVVDACQPRAPLELASLSTEGRSRSLALDTWRLYAGKRGLLGGGEFLLFDVHAPRQPVVAARLLLPDTVDSVAAQPGRFWAAAREAGLLAGTTADIYRPTPTADPRPPATRPAGLEAAAFLPLLRFDLPPRPCPAP